MFFILILLMTAGVSAAQPNNFLDGLWKEFAELANLVPVEKLTALAFNYYKNDPCFKAAIDYMQSPKFQSMLKDMYSNPNLLMILSKIELHFIEMERASKISKREVNDCEKPSMKNFLMEVDELAPIEDIYARIMAKVKTSEALRMVYNLLSSSEMRTLVMDFLDSEEVKLVIFELKNMDVPIDRYLQATFKFLGWI